MEKNEFEMQTNIENAEGMENGVSRKELHKLCNRNYWGGILTGLIIAAFIVVGSFVVSRFVVNAEKRQLKKDDWSKSEQESDSVITDEVMAKMKKIEAVIDTCYYQEDTDKEQLVEDAYKGMMASLGDPYSTYYSVEELEDLMEQSEGIYFGIGAYVSLDQQTGYAKISGVIEGTPAQEADLRDGDIIYEVDGVSAYGLELTEVVAMIKGEEGTTVHLTLVRDGEQDYVEKDVMRREIESPTVNYEMLDGQMGYIQITEFDDVTADQFAEALAVLRGQGMKGLILDLRSNPGGNLTTVVDIAKMLLPEGLIVYTENRYGNRQEYSCDGKREFQLPMVVLINGYSASASEILAGAIQDYEIGTLIGTTSYGKGIVQQIVSLKDGSAVKLTVSSYYTPKGRNIHGIGIEPDIVCEFDGDTYYNSEDKYDNQLEKAKEILSGQINPAE